MSVLLSKYPHIKAALLAIMLATLPATVYAQRAEFPNSAGAALRAGWKVVNISTTLGTGINPNKGGGIYDTYRYSLDSFLLQKGNDFIVCKRTAHNDTPKGEWVPFTSWCNEIE